jgi:hypothetical protein
MRFPRRFWSAATAIFLAACGASGSGSRTLDETPAPVRPPTALPVNGGLFIPGETMRFELGLRGVVGGEASIAVGAPGVVDGRRTIIVRSRVESAGVVAMFKEIKDEIQTSVDLDTGLPVRLQGHVKFGKRESTIDAAFRLPEAKVPGGYDLTIQRVGAAAPRLVHMIMPGQQPAFDSHTVIGAMRAWRAEDGQYTYFYVLVGRHLWQNTVRMTGRERLRTKLGRFDAVRIEGVARRMTRALKEDKKKPPRSFTLWMSDDDARLPLRVEAKTEYGVVEATLVDYQAPSQLRAAR